MSSFALREYAAPPGRVESQPAAPCPEIHGRGLQVRPRLNPPVNPPQQLTRKLSPQTHACQRATTCR